MYSKMVRFDIDLLQDIQQEFDEPLDKDQFMKEQILIRLEELDQKYLMEFRSWLKDIDDFLESDDYDVFDLARLLAKLNKCSKKLYDTELSLLRSLMW